MTAEVVHFTRDELEERRRSIIARIADGDLEALRQRAADHVLTPEERDLLLELREVDFLLGDDA
jgi:hypothetical protein